MKFAKMPDEPMITDANMKEEKNEDSDQSMSSGMSSESTSDSDSHDSEEEREKRLKALQDQVEWKLLMFLYSDIFSCSKLSNEVLKASLYLSKEPLENFNFKKVIYLQVHK